MTSWYQGHSINRSCSRTSEFQISKKIISVCKIKEYIPKEEPNVRNNSFNNKFCKLLQSKPLILRAQPTSDTCISAAVPSLPYVPHDIPSDDN